MATHCNVGSWMDLGPEDGASTGQLGQLAKCEWVKIQICIILMSFKILDNFTMVMQWCHYF